MTQCKCFTPTPEVRTASISIVLTTWSTIKWEYDIQNPNPWFMQQLCDCDVYSHSQKTFHLATHSGSKRSYHRQKDLNFKFLEYGLMKINLGQQIIHLYLPTNSWNCFEFRNIFGLLLGGLSKRYISTTSIMKLIYSVRRGAVGHKILSEMQCRPIWL
jgi:hypothetical protein